MKREQVYLLVLMIVIAVGIISYVMLNKNDLSGQAWSANECSDALQISSSLSWLTQCVQTRFATCPYARAPAQLGSAAQSVSQSIGQPGYGIMYDCIRSDNSYPNLLGDKFAQQNSVASDKVAAEAQLAAAVNRMRDAVNSLQGAPKPGRAWSAANWFKVKNALVNAVNNRKWDDLIVLIANFNTYTKGAYGPTVSKIKEDAASAKSLEQRISGYILTFNGNNQLISYCVTLFQKIIDKVNSCQPVCGNNVKEGSEACDDGNTVTETQCTAYGAGTLNACSADCSAAIALTCPVAPQASAPVASTAPTVTSAPASVGASSPETVVIEAESYSSRQPVIGNDKENRCSGQIVGYINRGTVLTFNNINVPSAGVYDIKYSIAAPQAAGTIALVIDDSVTIYSKGIITGKGRIAKTDQMGTPYYYQLGYRQTGDWGVCDDSLDSSANVDHTGARAMGATDYPNGIQLSKGTHTLSFVNVNNVGINVDWFKLVQRQAPVCGNGAREGKEVCDEGTALNGQPNHCDAQCSGTTAAVCGNNALEAGEQCDDGNKVDGDGCSTACLSEGPDLIVEDAYFNDRLTGQRVTGDFAGQKYLVAYVRVKNDGTAGAGPSNKCTKVLLDGSVFQIDGLGCMVNGVRQAINGLDNTTRPLNAGEYESPLDYAVHSFVASSVGEYCIISTADYDLSVVETNENNNVFSGRSTCIRRVS